MSVHTFRQEMWVASQRRDVFEFLTRPENFPSLNPQWMNVKLEDAPVEMREGAAIRFAMRLYGMPVRCSSEVRVWNPPKECLQAQASGPFTMWEHAYRFEDYAGGTRIIEEVQYSLPWGVLGELLHRLLIRRDLEAIFEYRRSRTCDQLGDGR